jgi:hypothetical protein
VRTLISSTLWNGHLDNHLLQSHEAILIVNSRSFCQMARIVAF